MHCMCSVDLFSGWFVILFYIRCLFHLLFLFLYLFDLLVIVLLLLLLIHWSIVAQGSLLYPRSSIPLLSHPLCSSRASFHFLFVFARFWLHSFFLIVLHLRFLHSGCFCMLSISPYNVNMWWRWWRDDWLLYKILLPVIFVFCVVSLLCAHCNPIETKELFNVADVGYHPFLCVCRP